MADEASHPNPAQGESEIASRSLAEAAERLGLELEPQVAAGIDAYCQQLWSWNEKINLTRHTNYDVFARRDLVDSLHLANLLEPGEEVLDVGTGGGVPGLVLAILRPDLQVSVCDSVAKKSKVVSEMVQALDLNVVVHACRVQDVLEDLRFHSLVTRAVGSLAQLLKWLEDGWLGFDRLLAIKGPRWVDERAEARHRGLLANLDLRKVDSYPMAGTDSDSVILQITRQKGN